MKLNNLYFSIIILFASVFISFAQCDPSLSDVDKQLCDNEQKLKELKVNLNEAYKPHIPDLSQYVPETKDSWLVTVIFNGGWAKTTRILATIKSDQNYLCREENLQTNHSISKDLFDPYNEMIWKTSFEKLLVFPQRSLANCVNCSATNLVVYQRKEIAEKNKKKLEINSYNFDIDNFTQQDSPVRKLFDKTLEISKCEEIKEYSK